MNIDTVGPTRILSLARPHRLNAMNGQEWSELLTNIRRAEDDEAIRCLVLRGEGRVFCAGNDIKETAAFTTTAQARAYFLDLMVPALAAMASSRLPIVAAVHGMALGAGLELMQFCDVVVAAESCKFQLPETGLGLWATVFLGSASYCTHPRATQYLALTGESISAQEALQWQLITGMVPDEGLLDAVMQIATKIATNAPRATALSKAFTNRTLLTEAMPVVREALSRLIDETLFKDESTEGVAAFLEKRRPNYGRSDGSASSRGEEKRSTVT